jgi:hypothetical protein
MAMFAARRVKKEQQEAVLRAYLPATITCLGAFDKSGNYALLSRTTADISAAAVLAALHRDMMLQTLTLQHITTIAAETVNTALTELTRSMRSRYRDKFNRRNFAVEVEERVWRAGLAFLSEPLSIADFVWPAGPASKVRVFEGSGQVVQFLKRENTPDEDRISFGDPTRAIDAALSEFLGRAIATTSRSGRTVRGVLRLFEFPDVSETTSEPRTASAPR